MENTTPFELTHAIRNWREELSRGPHFCAEDLAELESHLRDSVASLQQLGLSAEEAFVLAVRRLGGPAKLEPEFAKVNRGEVWRQRLVWMLVGIQGWWVITGVSHLFAETTVMVGVAGLGDYFTRSSPVLGASVVSAIVCFFVNLLALGGCLAGCWWIVGRKAAVAQRVALKGLKRPVLLGLILSLLLMAFNLSSWLKWFLWTRLYSIDLARNLATSQSMASFLLGVLQPVALVALTIVLVRRGLRLSRA